jgi:hypothetical protein
MHEINIPEVHAEVSAAFYRYEQALVSNDVAVLDELFYNNEHTLRFGVTENLFSYAEIAAFRASRPSQGLARKLIRTAHGMLTGLVERPHLPAGDRSKRARPDREA